MRIFGGRAYFMDHIVLSIGCRVEKKQEKEHDFWGNRNRYGRLYWRGDQLNQESYQEREGIRCPFHNDENKGRVHSMQSI